MRKLFRSLIAVGGLAGLVACGDDVTVGGPDFAISGAPVTAIQVGAKVQLSANEAATWASSATNVATVDNTGLVTAVAAGTATITATSTANPDRRASVTITVTAPAVRNVVVSPSNAVLKPGETQGFVANVDADPGVARTVTWTSTNTAVATVTSAGVVTAVAPGATTIVATSTANTTVSGAASVTVRQPLPATISVQNITITGTNGVTANVNNIAGSIDVNVNLDPGEQVVQRVEVLIDGNVACTQNLSGAQSEAARIAAAFENIEDVIISCQINTAAFAAATGIAQFPNGPHTLSARAVIAGGSDVATPSTPLIFNNVSGIIATFTNNNGSDPAAAINPGSGLQWIGGNVTLNIVGVSYVSGTTVASVSCNIFDKATRVIPVVNGVATVSYSESGDWSSTDLDVGRYNSPQAGESIVCGSATLSNGQPLVVAGPSVLLNFAPVGVTQNSTNASMPALQVLRLDNVAPGNVGSASIALNPSAPAQAAITIAAMVAPWVNASSTLTPSATGSSVNILGLPSLASLNSFTAGAGNDEDEGVDAITVAVWVPVAGQPLPTTGGACNLTGLTSVTTGSQLAETTVSGAYPARIVFTDALGNRACIDLVQAFGADFTAPTATITGPLANTGYNVSPPAFVVAPTDNASGFVADSLLRVSISRLNENGTTSCIINTGGSCTGGSTAAQANNLDATGNIATNVEGYYTTSITLVDAAGNQTVLVTNRLYSFDQSLPTFSGGISLPAVIAGGASNTFTTTVADSLDLGSIFGVVSYPGAALSIQFPTQVIGTFGAPLEQSSSNLGYVVANWIRCLNTPGNFAVAANQPANIALTVTDLTTIASTNTTTLTSGAFGANAQTCTGTVGNLGGTAVPNSFGPVTADYGTGNTQVDLDGVSVPANTSTTVTLKVVADVPLNTAVDPFTRVDFYYDSDPGAGITLTRIGTGTALLEQTLTNRTYTYSFVWDPAAPVPTGSVLVTAVGVDAQGDAVAATGVFVTIVP